MWILTVILQFQVTVYVHSESLVTHGVYVIFYGEESWRALETKRNVRPYH